MGGAARDAACDISPMESDEPIIREITGKIAGTPRKRPRRKPSRCVDCGKVSKRVRCNECWTRRLEI